MAKRAASLFFAGPSRERTRTTILKRIGFRGLLEITSMDIVRLG